MQSIVASNTRPRQQLVSLSIMKLLRLHSSSSPEKLHLVDSVLRDIITSESDMKRTDIACYVSTRTDRAAPSSSSRDKENAAMTNNDSLFASMSNPATSTPLNTTMNNDISNTEESKGGSSAPQGRIPISFRLQYSERERDLESSLFQYLRLRNRCKDTRKATSRANDSDISGAGMRCDSSGSDSNVIVDCEEDGPYDWDADTEVAQIKKIFEMRSFRSQLMHQASVD